MTCKSLSTSTRATAMEATDTNTRVTATYTRATAIRATVIMARAIKVFIFFKQILDKQNQLKCVLPNQVTAKDTAITVATTKLL